MRLLLFPAAFYVSIFIACGFGLQTLTAVEVDLLDGTQLRGSHIVLDSESLVLEEEHHLALKDVDQVRLRSPNDVLPQDHHGLLLKDGSWLPYTTMQAISDGVKVETPLGSMAIPLGSVVAWGSPDWVKQQRQQRQDQVLLTSDSSLSGTVLGISDGKLQLRSELADDPLTFALDEVSHLHLALPTDRPRGLHFTTSLSQGQPEVRLVAREGTVYLQAQPNQGIAVERLGQLQVQGGRRVFLSDLEPSEVQEEGAFGTVWHHAVNSNIDGSPLHLGGIYYPHGLVIHSRARLNWNLNGGYDRFQSQIGISDIMIPHNVGDCEVSIYVDGERRWHQASVRVGEPPQRVELDLRGAQTLSIFVDYGARYDIGDHLALAGAWLLRSE